MLRILPAPLAGAITLTCVVINTLFWCVPLFALALVKLLPIPTLRLRISLILARIAENWISVNNFLFHLAGPSRWEVTGLEGLRPDKWYLIISNHLSDVDIPVIQRTFNRRIPFSRVFTKQELFWFPILGQAWWALDYPFMKRYSNDYLKRRPEKRGHDLETTRRACEKFRHLPTSILNYVEGTRFSAQKHAEQSSPYRHLLRPRAGGIAYVLASMGEMFTSILDVTIIYPDGPVSLWDLLRGQVGHVIVDVRQRPVPVELLDGDYSGDPAFRERFQQWLHEVWLEKDELVERQRTEATQVAAPV
jgi:1-acyl-sn-glycerol-3-phosphate acyltransferase